MAWMDNGKGKWVQQTGEGEVNTPMPAYPPPSASGGSGGGLLDQNSLRQGQPTAGAGTAPPPPPLGLSTVPTTAAAWDAQKGQLDATIARNKPGTPRYQEALDALNRLGPRPGAAPSAGAPTVVGASGAGAAGPTPETPAVTPTSSDMLGVGKNQTTKTLGPGAAPAPAPPTAPALPAISVDYSRYDQAATGYDRAVNTFQSELDRLSGVDPFGNQAFLRKATDRAVGQAAGLAAGGLSTATARAGNMRQAQGVQSSLAAQGIEQQAVQRSQDEVQAGALRNQAATGLANVVGQKAQNEVELTKLQTETTAQNLQSYLDKYKFDAALSQQDVESVRALAEAYSRLDENARQADEGVLAQRYGIDTGMYNNLKQIAAQENMSFGDFTMGLMGAAGGVAAGIAGSDRNFKFDVRDPDLSDLQDFLGHTKGKLYRYKDPGKPGRRAGLNYGPMARDLAKSKIGKTVVVQGKDGLYVDTGRLALADHAALAELAREVAALKEAKK